MSRDTDAKLEKIAPWLLKARIVSNYAGFKKAIDAILQDDSLADADLEKQAMRHLETLSHPDMEQYNKPKQQILRRLAPEFSMKRLLEAIYWTAHDLDLKDGGRYVLAAICACDILVGEQVDGPGSDMATRPERLAIELTNLARLWHGFVIVHGMSPERGKESGMDVGEPIIQFSEETRKQVMQRDQYTCFKTGSADGGAMERSRLEVTPICERRFLGDRIDEQNPIRRMTTDFFQRVLGIDKLDVALDGPGNAILLDRYARSIWSSHHWTLKPTQIPNRYKIVDTFGPRKGDGGARNGVYISFADHSVDKHTTEKAHGVELPNRDLILLHAACASIQHRSGAFSFSAPRGWQPWLEGYLGPPNEDATRLAEGRIWGQDDLLPTINLEFQIFLFLVWVLFLLWWQPFDDVYVPLA